MDGNNRAFPRPKGYGSGQSSAPGGGPGRVQMRGQFERSSQITNQNQRIGQPQASASQSTIGFSVRREIVDSSAMPVRRTAGWMTNQRQNDGDESKGMLNPYASSLQTQNAVLDAVEDAVRTYGPAPGARRLLEAERVAAEHAMSRRIYVVWRCQRNAPRQVSAPVGQDCTRIGPKSLCFCGHMYGSHEENLARNSFKCLHDGCICNRFNYIPSTAEECGEWWLPRRREFNPATYRAKCKCGHTHLDHSPKGSAHPCRSCKCGAFNSAFLCVACDTHSEDHETIWETEDERIACGREVKEQFMPLAAAPRIASLVFDRRLPTNAQRLLGPSSTERKSSAGSGQMSNALISHSSGSPFGAGELAGSPAGGPVGGGAPRGVNRSPYVRYLPPRNQQVSNNTRSLYNQPSSRTMEHTATPHSFSASQVNGEGYDQDIGESYINSMHTRRIRGEPSADTKQALPPSVRRNSRFHR